MGRGVGNIVGSITPDGKERIKENSSALGRTDTIEFFLTVREVDAA